MNALADETVRQARLLAAHGKGPIEIAKIGNLQPAILTAAIRGITHQHIMNPPPVPATAPVPAPPMMNVSQSPKSPAWDTRRLDGPRLAALRQDKLGMTQGAFAMAIQTACIRLGYDASCSKRLIQKWESGEHALPLIAYQQALTRVTGESIGILCGRLPPSDPQQAARELGSIIAAATELQSRLCALYTLILDPSGPESIPTPLPPPNP